MKRRHYLLGCGVLLPGVAGCLGGSDDATQTPADTPTPTAEPAETPTPTEEPTPTPTESPTPTPTETPSPTPTETPTADPNVFTHELDERFTVGEDGNALTYRVIEYRRADRIGNQVNWIEPERGRFLVVIAELTNPQDRRIGLPRNDFRVRSPRTWRKFSEGATERLDIDDRVEEGSLANNSIASGRSAVGGVVFDVDPDQSWRVWITPADGPDTPSHFVDVGRVSALEGL